MSRKPRGHRHPPPAARAAGGPDAGRHPGDRPPGIRPRSRAPERPRPDPDTVQLWGFHTVREALRSDRRKPLRLFATEGAAARLAAELDARSLVPIPSSAEELAARLPRDAVHQGLLLEARPLPALGIDDLPDRGLVVVLDQVTDPHNVGAILRTAAAFGAVGLVTTERHAPEMTGVLGKAASGALEHVPVVTVVNLARALEALGDRGYTRIGLDSEGAVPLATVPLDPATALVLGAEGKGLRRLSRENCDAIAKLDFPGPIKSLNVSNACAAALTALHLRTAAS